MRGSGIRAASALGALLLLAACGPDAQGGSGAGPTPVQASKAPVLLPVPHGRGSDIADDFDGDGRADLAVRSYRSETRDTVAVYPGARKGPVAAEPAVRFSTTAFLAD